MLWEWIEWLLLHTAYQDNSGFDLYWLQCMMRDSLARRQCVPVWRIKQCCNQWHVNSQWKELFKGAEGSDHPETRNIQKHHWPMQVPRSPTSRPNVQVGQGRGGVRAFVAPQIAKNAGCPKIVLVGNWENGLWMLFFRYVFRQIQARHCILEEALPLSRIQSWNKPRPLIKSNRLTQNCDVKTCCLRILKIFWRY